MSQTKVTSILLGFIADCCVRLNKAGFNHLQVSEGHLRSWNHHLNIYIEVELSLPADCDPEIFQLSMKAIPENTKRLRSVGKRGGSIQMEVMEDIYRFNDSYTKNEIRKLKTTLISGRIADFVGTLQKQEANIPEITGRGELSLSGSEAHVLLGIYDGQLASLIIPNQQEQFFAQNVGRQMRRRQRKLYKSYGFLKFGEPDFNVSVHKGHEDLWLLTNGQFADNMSFSVLERLIPII